MTANRPHSTGPLDEAGIFEAFFYSPSPWAGWHGRVWIPPTDVYETEDDIVVQVELAGVQQADLAVALIDRRLTISGTRADRSAGRRAYHQMQVRFGDFRTEVELPAAVDEEQVDAEYRDGFLRVRLPKLKPRRVVVQE